MQTYSNFAVAQWLIGRSSVLFASLLLIQVAAAAVGMPPPRIIPGCGAAHGGISATVPTVGLCAAGYVSSVPKTPTGNGFEWACWLPGTPRSAIVACTAERAINGACGTASGSTTSTAPIAALCATGQATAITTTATGFSWSCTATPAAQGGVVASCVASKPIISVCGSAHGVAAWDAPSAPPNSNLCAVGTPTNV